MGDKAFKLVVKFLDTFRKINWDVLGQDDLVSNQFDVDNFAFFEAFHQ